MKRPFFIVGPTATGKSEIAVEVAAQMDGEVVNADAFQIYGGLDVLSGKPEAALLNKAPHHLIGTVPLDQEMNVEKFRGAAALALADIMSRGRSAIVVGGSGLYVKALTHGLASLPSADRRLRDELNQLDLAEACARLSQLDPETARRIDLKNRRRVVRALEICLLTGKPASAQRSQWESVSGVADPGPPRSATAGTTTGAFIFRNRAELYRRIDERVEKMFKSGVIDEVRKIGPISATASKMIGLAEIRELLEGRMSTAQCIAQIQQATHRYAKRQLTWFARQSNFEALNLTLLSHGASVDGITQLAKAFRVANRDD